MVGLEDLSAELLAKIADELDPQLQLQVLESLPRNDLLNLALANRSFFERVTPTFYRSFIYDGSRDASGRILRKYVELLREQPKLGQHIRVIVMHTLGWSRRDTKTGKIHDVNTLSSFIVSQAGKLRSLKIEYPEDVSFLNFQSETIEDLYVRPASGRWSNLSASDEKLPIGLLNLDFLPHVLSWPKLKTLCLEATEVLRQDELLRSKCNVLERTSPITNIVLRLGEITEKAISVLLRAPRVLTSFVHEPAKDVQIDMEDWDPDSYDDELPTTSTISAALQCHASTLQHLSIKRSSWHWNAKHDLFGSLSHFSSLISVAIDATMMLGWDHCDCISSGFTEEELAITPADPLTLGTMLPPSIEHVTIRLDRYPSHEDQTALSTLIAEGIATEIHRGRLARLKKLHFEPNRCSYCIGCDDDFVWTPWSLDLITLTDVPTYRTLRDVLAMSGCALTVDSTAPD